MSPAEEGEWITDLMEGSIEEGVWVKPWGSQRGGEAWRPPAGPGRWSRFWGNTHGGGTPGNRGRRGSGAVGGEGGLSRWSPERCLCASVSSMPPPPYSVDTLTRPTRGGTASRNMTEPAAAAAGRKGHGLNAAKGRGRDAPSRGGGAHRCGRPAPRRGEAHAGAVTRRWCLRRGGADSGSQGKVCTFLGSIATSRANNPT